MSATLQPNNILSEEIILGTILFNPQGADEIIDRLKVEAFYLSTHQKIYTEIVRAHQSQSLDLYTVVSRLEEPDSALAQLDGFVNRIISTGDVDGHVDAVLDCWRRRRLIELAHNLANQSRNIGTEVDLIRAYIEAELTDICFDVNRSPVKKLSEVVAELVKTLDQPHDALSLDVKDVDNLLSGGLRKKTFTVVAARPAMGKTWVGNFIAKAIAKLGSDTPAIIFSAEMSMEQLALRFLATEQKIDLGLLLERKLDGDKLKQVSNLNMDYPIYIDDTVGSALTVGHIETQCQLIRRQYGKMGVVIVDYIQLLGDRGTANRAGEVGKYSGALNDLSKKLDCPVIALAQLNRGVETRQKKIPILSDLKESGDIEQDASTVIFLYRPDRYEENTQVGANELVDLQLIFAKNRTGPCGTATVLFRPSTGEILNKAHGSDYGHSPQEDDF